MSESSLKLIEKSALFDELMKTFEGKEIARKLLSLSSELETLESNDKLRFNEEFGRKFFEIANFNPSEDSDYYWAVPYRIWPLILIVIVVLAAVVGTLMNGKEPKRKTRR